MQKQSDNFEQEMLPSFIFSYFAPKELRPGGFAFKYIAGEFVRIFIQEDLPACNGFYPPQLRLLMYVIGGREVGQVLT